VASIELIRKREKPDIVSIEHSIIGFVELKQLGAAEAAPMNFHLTMA
jgi:hypothetical protein